MGQPRGPKPAPTALKVASDTRPDRINDAEPPQIEGDPEPPDDLEGVALVEWRRKVPMFRSMGVLSRIDGTALALYCESFARRHEAAKMLKKNGMTAPTGKGGEKPSPYLIIVRAEEATMKQWLAEFGGTPSSRSRIKTPEQTKPKEGSLRAFLAAGKR